MQVWVILLGFCIAVSLSLWLRIRYYRATLAENLDTKATPLSLAVQNLVATAGGVYLSLIMLVSFLKLDIPDKLPLRGSSMDPLALIAMFLAIIQPVFLKILNIKSK